VYPRNRAPKIAPGAFEWHDPAGVGAPKQQRLLPVYLLLAAAAQAEPAGVGSELGPVELEDQHGLTHRIGDAVQVILLSRDMQGGDVIREALAGRDAEFFAKREIVYVADIHRMPGLVARLFAIPKMRERAYPMLLDRDGEATRDWPASAEGRALLIRVDALRITAVESYASPEQLAAALEPSAVPLR